MSDPLQETLSPCSDRDARIAELENEVVRLLHACNKTKEQSMECMQDQPCVSHLAYEDAEDKITELRALIREKDAALRQIANDAKFIHVYGRDLARAALEKKETP